MGGENWLESQVAILYSHTFRFHGEKIRLLTLNDWSRGEQWILFPENPNVSRDEVETKSKSTNSGGFKQKLTKNVGCSVLPGGSENTN